MAGMLLSSCDAKSRLMRLTGIDICRAASVRSVDSGEDGVSQFDIVVEEGECVPSFLDSLPEANRGCGIVIQRGGRCGYDHIGRGVSVERKSAAAEPKQHYIVKTW